MMDMVGVVTAMAVEGNVFRRAWGLKAMDTDGPFRCYGNDDRILAISGTGRIRCAAAAAWLLSQFPEIRDGILLNAGIAGSGALGIGSAHIIHQVVDAATGRRFYPDILFAHPYGEATLYTVDRPMEKLAEGMGNGDLIDMEGAAFLEAAGLFVPCHRAHIVKVVSDNLTPEKIDRGDITRLMEKALPAVEYIIGAIPRGGEQGNIAERMEVFARIGERWRLTLSQRAQLNRAGRAWLLRHPEGDCVWSDDMDAPRDKQSRNKTLAVLIDRLWGG